MRITNRDLKIIEFIEKNGIISSSQIQRLFNLEQRYQSKRMNFLTKEFPIKKLKYNPTHNFYEQGKQLLKNENVYYIGRKPRSIEHDLLLNEFYIKLLDMQKAGYKILLYDTKFKINVDDFVVIPDARIIIEYDGVEYEYLIELENNKSFNYKKYYALEQKGYICCPVLVITNRLVKNYCKNLELIKIKLNLSNIDNFINDFMNSNSKTKEKYKYRIIPGDFTSNPF